MSKCPNCKIYSILLFSGFVQCLQCKTERISIFSMLFLSTGWKKHSFAHSFIRRECKLLAICLITYRLKGPMACTPQNIHSNAKIDQSMCIWNYLKSRRNSFSMSNFINRIERKNRVESDMICTKWLRLQTKMFNKLKARFNLFLNLKHEGNLREKTYFLLQVCNFRVSSSSENLTSSRRKQISTLRFSFHFHSSSSIGNVKMP